MQAMEISRSALDVEWRRLEIVAQNLANVNSAQTGASGPYRAQRLISGPRFASYLQQGGAAAPGTNLQALGGVAVYGIEQDSAPPRLVREPGNPNADAKGFVAYPAIDHAEQMTMMIKTARAYEANLVMLNIARQMYGKALELGGR